MMRAFLEYIMKGKFRLTVCVFCKKKIWPPSKFCCYCLSKTRLTRVTLTGKVLEFSISRTKNISTPFGIIQMNGFRLLGSILEDHPYCGMSVTMIKCGIGSTGSIFYEFKATEKVVTGYRLKT
jgi:uncharacterized OB-fold protein